MELARLSGPSGLVVLVDVSRAMPAIVHWGVDAGPVELSPPLFDRPRAPATLDTEPPLTILPTVGDGPVSAFGLELTGPDGPVVPVLEASTSDPEPPDGRAEPPDGRAEPPDGCAEPLDGRAYPPDGCAEPPDGGAVIHRRLTDSANGVAVDVTIAVGEVLTIDVAVTNTGADVLGVARVHPTLPVDERATEIVRFDGRWCREFQSHRHPWTGGTVVVDNRRGRTSHDRPPLLFATTAGAGEHTGQVWGVHLAWSGNHELRLDRGTDGRATVSAGEALLAGEIRLGPGERYDAPTVLAAHGVGMTACSRRFHRAIRARSPRPDPPSRRPRPVVCNTWEAVYFDHDADRLRALADRAAAVGAERFVLDDGWFGGRRDDTAGLGDWTVSADAHPDGLGPLIDHVTALGMEFGIWVEPEMVNPDSDLYRAHPEWVLGNPTVTGRNQLVLDLAHDACRAHLLTQLDALLAGHDIAFVKWDMNRDLAGAGAARQTRALYRLLDGLRARHPDVEFESCASGGGRADAEILTRTARIWTSDCNDPVERAAIQHGFSHLFPPEVMGAHVGPPRAHTTGRTSRTAFRAAVALFGHLGIEWNLLDATDRQLETLAAWVALHKRLRPLLHGGDIVRLDPLDGTALAHGVVDAAAGHAVFVHLQCAAPVSSVPPGFRLAGLDAERRYRVTHLAMPGEVHGLGLRRPAWMDGPVDVTGAALTEIGLPLPVLFPETAVLVELTAT